MKKIHETRQTRNPADPGQTAEPKQREHEQPADPDEVERNHRNQADDVLGKPRRISQKEVQKSVPADPDPDDPVSL